MLNLWIGFLSLVVLFLAIDLGVFTKRGSTEMNLRQAVIWSLVWISAGLLFSGAVYFIFDSALYGSRYHLADGTAVPVEQAGKLAAMQYLTAFVLEKALSVDNLFVIGLVFKSFGVGERHQHRVLFWGIFGAIVLRGTMILLGFELVAKYEWLFIVFGLYLIYQGGKILFEKDDDGDDDAEEEREQGLLERGLRKIIPLSDEYDGDRFTTRMNGAFQFTPLVICLFVVEITDLVFAADSIPAVLAVSTERFIAFTSNIFAVLGLRTLYFVLRELVERFSYLETSISVILVFIGIKLCLHHWAHALPEWVSLAFIGCCLAAGVAWSWKKGGEEILRKSQLPKPGTLPPEPPPA